MATKKLELHDTIKTWMEKINDNLTVIDGIEVADFEQLVNAANTINEKLVEVDESVSLSKDWANKTDATVDGVEFSAKKYALDAKDSEETSVLSATVAGTKAVEVNTSVLEASTFADQAYNSKTAAKTSEDKAKVSELAAKQSETNAASSASTALGYRNAAEQAATVATGARNEAIEAKDDAVAEANDIRTNWQDKLDAAAQYALDAEEIKTEIRNWYYGPLEADPVTRPDGTPVQVGDEYHDSVNHVRKVYSNGVWQDVSAAALAMPGGAALVGQGALNSESLQNLMGLLPALKKSDLAYFSKGSAFRLVDGEFKPEKEVNIEALGAVSGVLFESWPDEFKHDCTIYIPRGFTLKLQPWFPIELNNVKLYGEGTIESGNALRPIFDVSGNFTLDGVECINVGEFIYSTSGFDTVTVKNVKANGFGRFMYVTGVTQKRVTFINNQFVGVPGWDINTVAPSRGCTVYYTTKKDRDGTALFLHNDVSNLVSEGEDRCDGFLARVGTYVAAFNNIRNIMSNRSEYIHNGYFTFGVSLDSSSLYSSSLRNFYIGNTVINGGIKSLVSVDENDYFEVVGNVIKFDVNDLPDGSPTLGGEFSPWVIRGLYSRSVNTIVDANQFHNIPWDVHVFASPETALMENKSFICSNNLFRKKRLATGVFGGFGGKNIVVQGFPRNIKVSGNIFDGNDDSYRENNWHNGSTANLFIIPNVNYDTTNVSFTDNTISNFEVIGTPSSRASVRFLASSEGKKVNSLSISGNNYTDNIGLNHVLSSDMELDCVNITNNHSGPNVGIIPMSYASVPSFKDVILDGYPNPSSLYVPITRTIPANTQSMTISLNTLFGGKVDMDLYKNNISIYSPDGVPILLIDVTSNSITVGLNEVRAVGTTVYIKFNLNNVAVSSI